MKTLLRIHKILLFILLFKCDYIFAQYPPSQGPPAVNRSNPYSSLELNTITELMGTYFRNTIIPEINAELAANGSGVSLSIHTLTRKNPYLSSTTNTSTPNENIILIPFQIDYELHIPHAPNRHLLQNIKIIAKCENWFLDSGGNIKLLIEADAIYLADPSWTEEVINSLTLGYYTNYVDAKIKDKLRNNSGELRTSISLSNLKCNCLSLSKGLIGITNKDIDYQFIRPSLAPNGNLFNQTQVSLVRVRRLEARNFQTNSILYDDVENVSFEIYINQKLQLFQNSMIEGQIYTPPSNSITIKRPGKDESLIIIANVIQHNDRIDSKFVEYKYEQNFGHGQQNIIVKKEFYTRLSSPNGGTSRPVKMLVDAYEFTFDIKSPLGQMDRP